MPIYKLNGKQYNIPDDVVRDFEVDNPDATQAYKDDTGIYDIAVKDRDNFLGKWHKDAQLYDDSQVEQKQEQSPVAQAKSQTLPSTGNSPEVGTDYNSVLMDTFTPSPVPAKSKKQSEPEKYVVAQDKEEPLTGDNIQDKIKGNLKLPEPAIRANNTAEEKADDSFADFQDQGFFPQLKQNIKSKMYAYQNLAGETLNLFTGTSRDDAEALKLAQDKRNKNLLNESGLFDSQKDMDDWNSLQFQLSYITDKKERRRLVRQYTNDLIDKGYTEYLMAVDKAGNASKAEQDMIARQRAEKLVGKAVAAAEGDIDEALYNLQQSASKKSLGDKMTDKAAANMATLKPSAGFGAWAADMTTLLGDIATSVAISAITKNQALGKAYMDAIIFAPSASNAMMQARESGATTAQTWGAGLADAAVMKAAFSIPMSKYTKRIIGDSAKAVSEKLGIALENNPKVKMEFEDLLKKVSKDSKLFSGENIKNYAAEILGTGGTIAAASTMQSLVPYIYTHKEDYPSLAKALEDTGKAALEGAVDGIMLGAVMGGATRVADNVIQRNRRNKQGFVAFGEADMSETGDGSDMQPVEFVGLGKKDISYSKDLATSDMPNWASRKGEYNTVLARRSDGSVVEIGIGRVGSFNTVDVETFNRGYLNQLADESYARGENIAKDYLEAKMYPGRQEQITDGNGQVLPPSDSPKLLVAGQPLQGMSDAEVAMHDARNKYDFAKDQLKNQLGIEDIDASGIMDQIQFGEITPEQQKVALDYLNAKNAYQGVVDGLRTEIEDRISASDRLIDSNTNTTMGQIVPAKMKANDRPVYITGGIVVRNEDGTIDKTKSEGSVIIKDMTTGESEMVDPDAILTVDMPINPYEEKSLAKTHIEQDIAVPAADAIDGVLPFRPGDTYQLTNAEGVVFPVQVVANEQGFVDNGDGTVNVVLNPQANGQNVISQMPKEEIQQLYEATQMARLAAFEENQQADFLQKQNSPDNIPQEMVQESGVQPEQTVDNQPAIERIPVDEKGQPVFENATPEDTWQAILDMNEGESVDALDTVSQMLANAQSEFDKVNKTKQKPGKTVMEIQANKAAQKASISAAQAKVDYWQSVAGVEARRQAELKAQEEAAVAEQKLQEERAAKQREAELNEANTLEQLTSNFFKNLFIGKKLFGTIDKADFMRETGLGETEAKKYFSWFAKKGHGKSIAQLAEELADFDVENGTAFVGSDINAAIQSTENARAAIIDMIRQSRVPSDLYNYTRQENERMMQEAEEYYNNVPEAVENAEPVENIPEDMPEFSEKNNTPEANKQDKIDIWGEVEKPESEIPSMGDKKDDSHLLNYLQETAKYNPTYKDAILGSNSVPKAIDRIKEVQAKLGKEKEKWENKSYKKTDYGTTLVDNDDNRRSYSYTQLNEKRRKNTINGLNQQIEDGNMFINVLQGNDVDFNRRAKDFAETKAKYVNANPETFITDTYQNRFTANNEDLNKAINLAEQANVDSGIIDGLKRESKRRAQQEFVNSISSEGQDATLVSRDNFDTVMKDNGCTSNQIQQVAEVMNDPDYLVQGFRDTRGNIYLISDKLDNEGQIAITYVHERSHNITANNGEETKVKDMFTHDELLLTVQKLAGTMDKDGNVVDLNYGYDAYSDRILASEAVSFADEIAFKSDPENLEENLRKAGITNDNFINFVKNRDYGQRNDESLSLPRRYTNVRQSEAGNSQNDGRNQETGSQEMGRPRYGSPERSETEVRSGAAERIANEIVDSDPNLTPEGKSFLKEYNDVFADSPKESGLMFSFTRNPEIEKKSAKAFDKNKDKLSFDKNTLDNADKAISAMCDIFKMYADKEYDGVRVLPRDVVRKGLKTIFNNGSYGKTMENTLKCLRTLAYDDFVDAVKESLGRPLTTGESFLASQMLYEIATDPQCLYCYVSLDRKAYDEYLLKYMNEDRDYAISKLKESGKEFSPLPKQTASKAERKSTDTLGDHPLAELYKDFLKGRADSQEMRNRYNLWLRNADNLISLEDLTTEDKRNEIKAAGGELAKQVIDAEKYAQAASWAKANADYRAYFSEILNLSQAKVDELNSEYGLRFYSFSEYSPAFIVENMQMFRDAAIRGFRGLAYTKETDFPKIFAPTGVNINVSTFGRRAEDGSIVPDTRQGADWDEVKALREQYSNVGGVFVATDDAMCQWALDQDWIDVIIPFHIVRTGQQTADYYGWVNHTAMQADKERETGKSKDIMPTEHLNDKDTFLTLCDERGLKPRFADLKLADGRSVVEHPNYMRFVNETRLSVNESSSLKPVFNLPEAEKSFSDFVEKGGYYGGWWTVDQQGVKDAVNQVVSDIKAGKEAKDVEYGNQLAPKDTETLRRMAARQRRAKTHGNIPLHVGDKMKTEKDDLNFRKTRRSDEDREKLFEEAKKEFGVTNDFREAGYILPDGKMLDFSEKNNGGEAGRRDRDHREIQLAVKDREYDTQTDYMTDFVNEGAVRLQPELPGISIIQPLTDKQVSAVKRFIDRHNGEVVVEVMNDGGYTEGYKEYDKWTSPSRIINDINNHFNGKTLGDGDMMFRKQHLLFDSGDGATIYSMGNLPSGVEGENSALVERVYRRTGAFSFTGKNKIETLNDVAYIFKQLEDAATENAFLALVKDGKPTILHVGIGTIDQTIIDFGTLIAAYRDFAPDAIYMVHNHPSGSIEASKGDIQMLEKIQKMVPETRCTGIIIDTISGKYGKFSPVGVKGSGTMDENVKDEAPIEVLSFDRLVFSPYYRREMSARNPVKGPQDVAAFLSAHRLGFNDKLGALITNKHSIVVGNLVSDYTCLDVDNAEMIADDIVDAAIRANGSGVILFGDFNIDTDALQPFADAILNKGGSSIKLHDIVRVDGNRTKAASDDSLFFRKANQNQIGFASNAAKAVEKKVEDINIPGINGTVHSVKMTPEMKESSMEGQLMFSKKATNPSEDSNKYNKITPEEDKAYFDVVESGKIDDARDMVESAARKAGYTTPILYHGTGKFGFTRFDSKRKSGAIFTSSARNVAANYAGDANYASPRQISKGYKDPKNIQDTIDNAKSVFNQDYRVATEEERKAVVNDVMSRAKEVAKKINDIMGKATYGEGALGNDFAWVANIIYDAADALDNGNEPKDVAKFLKTDYERFKESKQSIKNYEGELSAEEKELANYLTGYEVGDLAIDAGLSMMKALSEGDVLTVDGEQFITPEEANDAIARAKNIGAYSLYGNLGDNPLEIDAEGKAWYNLAFNGMSNTDDIVEWAKENGYTSVVVKNVYDYGDKADDYIFFSPEHLKSADPVTYDDNGNVIPLSERFNKNNNDIRFRKVNDKFMSEARKEGIPAIIGREQYDDVMRKAFESADGDIRKKITEMASKNGWNMWGAVQQYLASLAENGEYPYEYLRNVRDILNATAGSDITVNDMLYLMWREQNKPEGVFGAAEDVLMKEKLGIDGISFSKKPKMPLTPGPAPQYGVNAQDIYEALTKGSLYQIQEATQDSMLGLKRLYEAVTEAEGKKMHIEDIDDYENAYLAENSLSSRNKAEIDQINRVYQQLEKLATSIDKGKKGYEATKDYLMAKHGLERNVYMNDKAKAEAAANGQVWSGPEDYAGLSGLTGDKVNYEAKAQQMVADYEANHDKAQVDEMWKLINTLTEASLAKLHQSGLLSTDMYNTIRSRYQYYVPLRGFDEKISQDIYAYFSHGNEGDFTPAIRKAVKRTSKATNPIATIFNMVGSSIIQGNRNQMKQRFANFVLNHPSDLVSASEIWLRKNPISGEWEPVFAQLDKDDSADVIRQKVEAFDKTMAILAAGDPDNYKKGKEAANVPFKVLPENLNEHQVIVKKNGVPMILTINGSPRAAQALNGQTNPHNDDRKVLQSIIDAASALTRALSYVVTSASPDFIGANGVRDMGYTNVMEWVRENPKYAAKFNANFVVCNYARMTDLFRKYRKGTLDPNDYMEKMFGDFMINGGETGYSNNRSIDQLERRLKQLAKRGKWNKLHPDTVVSLLFDKIDVVNRSIENSARFAAFLTSREEGRTIARSIYDAKEVSVNFNKKGAGGKYFKSEGQTFAGNTASFVSEYAQILVPFFNPAIQGSYNLFKHLQGDRNRAKVLGVMAGTFVLGLLMASIGAGDDDEEQFKEAMLRDRMKHADTPEKRLEYEKQIAEIEKRRYLNQSDVVRRSNILFRAGDAFVSIPLSQEYRVFYGLGELAGNLMSGVKMSPEDVALQTAQQLTQILPIDPLEGKGGLSAFLPGAVKPIHEINTNISWSGYPITYANKEDLWPMYTKAGKTTSKPIVEATKAINEITGGDDYTKGSLNLNPDKIEHLLNGYFGGYYRLANQLVKDVEMIAGERDFDWRNVPVANRFVKMGNENSQFRKTNNDYRRFIEEYDETATRLNGYSTEMQKGSEEYTDKYNELVASPEFKRYLIMKPYRHNIDSINRNLKDPDLSDEQRDYMVSIQRQLKAECVFDLQQTMMDFEED